MLPIDPRNVLAPLLHISENVFSYAYQKAVWMRVDVFYGSRGDLSETERKRLATQVKREAIDMLAAGGIRGASASMKDGEIECPSFLGTEIMALLGSELLYQHIAYIVEKTMDEQAVTPQRAQPAAASPSPPPPSAQINASDAMRNHLLRMAESHEEEQEEAETLGQLDISEEQLDELQTTGRVGALLRLFRLFDRIASFLDHISSVNYEETAEGREQHANTARQLARTVLDARERATMATSDLRSSYDVIITIVVPQNILDHGHLLVLAREDGQEKKNQEAKTLVRKCICKIRKEVTFTRKNGKVVTVTNTAVKQLARQLVLREMAVCSAAAYVSHYAEDYQGQKLRHAIENGKVRRLHGSLEKLYTRRASSRHRRTLLKPATRMLTDDDQ